MKHKKLWIFIGIIVLILILNHIFGWSSYLGNTENLKVPGKYGTGKFSVGVLASIPYLPS